jgi:MFS family permease
VIGVIAASARLLAVPVALLGPVLARRVGYGEAAVLGSLGSVISMAPLILIPTPAAAGIGFVGLLAFTSIRYPTFYVFMMERTPPRLRAAMTGAGEMAAGLSFALVSLAGGYIIVRYGYDATFLLGAVITLAGTLLFGVYVWWLRKRRWWDSQGWRSGSREGETRRQGDKETRRQGGMVKSRPSPLATLTEIFAATVPFRRRWR